MLDKNSEDWIKEQEQLIEVGSEIVRQASDEALEYLADAVQNIDDRQWRKMVVSTQSKEMGVGTALAEVLVPEIYRDMEKTMHKKLKISKPVAKALRHIYIGRVIKNIRKALDERDN